MHTVILSKLIVLSRLITGEHVNEPVSFFNVPNEVIANKLIKLVGSYTRFIIEREKLKTSQVSIFIGTFPYYIFLCLIVHERRFHKKHY